MTEQEKTLALCEQLVNAFHLKFSPEDLADRAYQAGIKLLDWQTPYGSRWLSVEEISYEIVATGMKTSRELPTFGQNTKPDTAILPTKPDMGAVTVLPYDPGTDLVLMVREPRLTGVM